MRTALWIVLLVACGTPRAVASQPPVAELTEARASHGASLLGDGTVLIVGGFRKGADGFQQIYSDTTDIYDPRTDRVTPGPRLVHARGGQLTVALADGSILVAGGWSADGPIRSCERFDPAARVWTPVGDLAEPRGAATATRLADGRVVVIGGGDDGRPLASIEIYDPRTRSWSTGGALTTPRAGHTATLLADQTIVVAGGASGHGAVLETIERYDARTRRSVGAGSLLQPRYKHGAVLLPTGEVLVIGGSDARDWRGKYDSTELFEPRTGRTRAGPVLVAPRFKLPNAVVELPDGTIAVAGGAPSIELVRGTASRRAVTLDVASYYGTATLLPSGELVIAGGYDDRVRISSTIFRVQL